jgi:hypothetical protein
MSFSAATVAAAATSLHTAISGVSFRCIIAFFSFLSFFLFLLLPHSLPTRKTSAVCSSDQDGQQEEESSSILEIDGVLFWYCRGCSRAAPERLLRRSFSDDPSSSSSSSSCTRRGASRKVVFVPAAVAAAAKKSLVEGISPDTPQQSSRVATRRARKTGKCVLEFLEQSLL